MADEPGIPEDQHKPPSIWDTFNKNRVTKPKITEPNDITVEDKESGIDVRAVIKGFYADVQAFAPQGEHLYQNKDISVVLHKEYGSDRTVDGVLYEDDTMMVEVMSGTDSDGKVRMLTFEDGVYPEYFTDGEKLIQIVNRYEFETDGTARKVEEMTPFVDSPREKGIDRTKLTEFTGFYQAKNKIEKQLRPSLLGEDTTITHEVNELSSGDMELLQSIFTDLKAGKLPENPDWEPIQR